MIFLNTWNGKMSGGIKDFIAEESPRTDIFCLQEVYDSAKLMFGDLLPDFKGIYAHKDIDNDHGFSQATYVKKTLELCASNALLDDIPSVGLYTEIKWNGGSVHICNFHGVAYPKDDKLDNGERLRQSRALIEFLRPLVGLKVTGGDFNVSPDTKSIRVFEESGHRDLVRRHDIQTTRNRLAWEAHPGH